MKHLNSITLFALGSIIIFTPALAWKDTSKHYLHSVHSTKTHHRAKTTLSFLPALETYSTNTDDKPSIAASTCTPVPPGTKDTPAISDPSTNFVFRKSCGITDKTVEACPFLCGPGDEGDLKACFHEDISNYGGNGQEICRHCLAPCKNETDEPVTSDKSTPTLAPPVTCTSVPAGATDTPASKDPNTGLLFRSSCGITAETVSECHYLCSQAGGGTFKECSDTDLSGDEPDGQFPPVVCTHCLPPCKSQIFKRE